MKNAIVVSYIDEDNMKFLKRGEREGIDNAVILFVAKN